MWYFISRWVLGGREGRGFESGSWLVFFCFRFFFWGGGECVFQNEVLLGGGWGGFHFIVLEGLFFIKGTFCLLIFFLCFVVELS